MINRPAYNKYSTEELMELIKLFNVSSETQNKIKDLLAADNPPPNAGTLFRYYNPSSKCAEFEKLVSEKIGCDYALTVNSGTSALIAALIAAGVGPGDEVIIPAYTFFATASAVVVANAIPVICEINESLTIDPAAIEKSITSKTKVIMPVHMIGHPCEMDKICELAQKYNLIVIEDVAQAFGAKYQGKYLGTWGDIGCISLNAYKVISTGEGGIIMTNNRQLYMRAQNYHDTGAGWRTAGADKAYSDSELFCGENYRMPELCAAVALAQLKKLDWINNMTRKIYFELKDVIKLPDGAKWVEPNDAGGLCGYALGILFDSSEQAATAIVAAGLGGLSATETRGVRDWHVYWNWDQIIEKRTVTAAGYPYTYPQVENPPAYSKDMCPVTKNIMLRLTVIEITPHMDSAWVAERAAEINAGFLEM